MPANVNPIFVLTPNVKGQTFLPADGTAKKDVFVAGSNGSLLRAMSAISDDTALVNLDLFLNDGATDYGIGTIQVPIGAGTTAASAAANLLDTTKIRVLLQPDGSLFLPTGWTIKAAAKAAITAAKTVTVVAAGGNY